MHIGHSLPIYAEQTDWRYSLSSEMVEEHKKAKEQKAYIHIYMHIGYSFSLMCSVFMLGSKEFFFFLDNVPFCSVRYRYKYVRDLS